MPAPIALFVYNRPDHTRRTVEALRANVLAAESDLFIYADAAKNAAADPSVVAVREYVATITGFRSITIGARETNMGVDASVIDGVTTLSARFGAVIVVEDDIVTSRWFLTYMNDALERYRHEPRVMQIGGFMFPIKMKSDSSASLIPSITSWGWATWSRAWKLYDPGVSIYKELKASRAKKFSYDFHGSFYSFWMLTEFVEGRSQAWDVCWYATLYKNKGLTLFPHRTLVDNIGLDGSGVHSRPEDHLSLTLATNPIRSFAPVVCDYVLLKRYEAALREWLGSEEMSYRLKRWVKNFFFGSLRHEQRHAVAPDPTN